MSDGTVLVIGHSGQLGRQLLRDLHQPEWPQKYEWRVIGVSRHEEAAFDSSTFNCRMYSFQSIDITDYSITERVITHHNPNIIIVTAGCPDPMYCELFPEHAFKHNTQGMINVARAAQKIGAYLIYISTDNVFGRGFKNCVEDTPVCPVNVYGVSKAAAEQAVFAYCERALVVRTSALFGPDKCLGKARENFVVAMINKAKAITEGKADKFNSVPDGLDNNVIYLPDSHCTPTYTKDLSKGIANILQHPKETSRKAQCIVHLTNHGSPTWIEFAEYIIKEAGYHVPVELLPDDRVFNEFGKPKRVDVCLCTDVPLLYGHDILHVTVRTRWQDAVRHYMFNYLEST